MYLLFFVPLVSSCLSLLLCPPANAAAPDKSGVKPQVLSLPSGPGSIEGLGGSFEPQLNTGTSAYNVPLAVPPGRNDMEPKLALTYDSGAGNGHFGLGWKLPLESIHRQFDKGIPNYGGEDVFVYSNGEELVPLADGTWRCENESDFMRFRRNGDGWEVTARNGTVYHLGSSAHSRVVNPAAVGLPFDRTFRWLVDAVVDTNGNRIDYFYERSDDSPGELYLSEIRYNLNGSAFQSVVFDYEERADAFSDYRGGFLIRTARRGVSVRMLSRGELVREYRLSYESTASEVYGDGGAPPAGVELKTSLLTKVVQFDRNGRNYLPPLRFGYTRLQSAAAPALRQMANAPLALVQRIVSGSADLLDVDGDGLPDVLDTTDAQHVYYPNLGRDRFGAAGIMAVGGEPLEITGASLGQNTAVLADMEGDGMSDLLRAPGDVVYRNRGDGSWAEGAAFENFPFAGLNGPDLRWMDVNFDKATDVVVSQSGSQWLVCRNPNKLDVDHPPFGNFPGPEDVWHSQRPGHDRNANDVGCGQPASNPIVRPLEAGSWSCRTVAMPFPEHITFGNPAVQLADMNGDRIQDVVEVQVVSTSERSVRYWPGKGNLEFDDATVIAPVPVSIGAGITDANLKLIDVNSDGLSDLLAVGNGFLRFWINLGGDSWSEGHDVDDLPPLDDETALRFADMNGSGTTDVVWIRAFGATPGWYYLDFSGPARPNQLNLIDNGLGRRIEIQYASSTDYMIAARDDVDPPNPWTLLSPSPFQVVSRVITRPSLELDGQPGEDAYVTEFLYRDAYYDGYEKEFRGFAFVRKMELGDSTAPTQLTRIWFHTGAPDCEDNNVDERSEKGGVEEETLKGRVLRQQIADGSDLPTAGAIAAALPDDGYQAAPDIVFNTAQNMWITRLIHATKGGRRAIATLDERNVTFAFARQSDTELTERGRGEPKNLRTVTDYDHFGNLTFQGEEGALERTGDERYTFSQFAHNTTNWIVDKAVSRTVRAVPTETGEFVTRARFYYDGPAYQGLPHDGADSSAWVTVGNLTREELFVSENEVIDSSRKAFDEHGNVVGIMDPLGDPLAGASAGHLTEVEYDPVFHTFPVKETIHVGDGKPALVMTADYDLGFGTVSSALDFNGHISRFRYDSFGRAVSIQKPLDPDGSPSQQFSYHMSDPFRAVIYDYAPDGTMSSRFTVAPSFTVTLDREEIGKPGAIEVRQYTDGMGRSLATIQEGEAGFIAKDAVLFNARGTARRRYQPFDTGSADYSLGFANYFTDMEHDASGRQVRVVHPPEKESCGGSGCRSSVTTLFEPLRKTVIDENGNEMSYVTDGLKPLDDEGERLVEVQEENGGDRYLTFYDYNPANSLTRIEDSQQNVTVFAYDGLQRKVFANHPDRGVISYDYDAASNVKETVDANLRRITYDYDGLNRLVAEDYDDDHPQYPFSAHRSPDVTYTYDLPIGPIELGDGTSVTQTNTRGFLTSVTDLSGGEFTSYDARGRISWTVKALHDPELGIDVPYRTALSYDAKDRVRELIYPDGDRLLYEYNARGLVERVVGGPTGAIIENIDYLPSGQLDRCAYGNGVETTYGYDPRLRMGSLRTQRAPGDDLLHYDYSIDPASNILRIDDLRPLDALGGAAVRNTQVFQYDDLYRLTQVEYLNGGTATGSIQYSYDRIGNMLSQTSNIPHIERGRSVTSLGTMTYGATAGRSGRIGRAAGELPGPHALTTTSAGSALEYDDNGNVTELDGTTLTYDFKDRIVVAESDEMRAEYVYDYTDRRVIKKVQQKATPLNPRPPPPEVTTYVDRLFEVREHSQPVKYVFNSETRVARVTGSLDASTQRVQRLKLLPGWNLVALALETDDVSNQLLAAEPQISSVYRWDAAEHGYAPVAASEDLPAGSVLWIRSDAAAVIPLRGFDIGRSPPQLSGGGYFGVPSLDALRVFETLLSKPPVWTFSAATQEWDLSGIDSLPSAIEDPYDYLPPGGAFFVNPGWVDTPQAVPPADSIQYYHQDHLGSSNIVSNAAAAFTEEATFYPFGHPRIIRQAPGMREITRGNYRFSQKEFDRESGLQNFEARTLIANLGRFSSVDAATSDPQLVRDPLLLNPYAYVRNRPVVRIDPSGNLDRDAVRAGLMIAGAGVASFAIGIVGIATATVGTATVVGIPLAVASASISVGALSVGIVGIVSGLTLASAGVAASPGGADAKNLIKSAGDLEKALEFPQRILNPAAGGAWATGKAVEYASGSETAGKVTESVLNLGTGVTGKYSAAYEFLKAPTNLTKVSSAMGVAQGAYDTTKSVIDLGKSMNEKK
ncbi:MAG TPA: SpvB/TcaC N-terminal domain-containing protein [Terriglobales bacterium]|nr:SpvB/TcaC N-terminal domain-containing protein [Terriglobales bacterium]